VQRIADRTTADRLAEIVGLTSWLRRELRPAHFDLALRLAELRTADVACARCGAPSPTARTGLAIEALARQTASDDWLRRVGRVVAGKLAWLQTPPEPH
jgi:hypothetical protein